jgi:hypothetical protein
MWDKNELSVFAYNEGIQTGLEIALRHIKEVSNKWAGSTPRAGAQIRLACGLLEDAIRAEIEKLKEQTDAG